MMVLWLLSCHQAENTVPEDVPLYNVSVDALENLVNQAFSTGLPSMLDIDAQYEYLMSLADETCPQFTGMSDGLNGIWVDDCFTQDGYHFMGFSMFTSLGEPGQQGEPEDQLENPDEGNQSNSMENLDPDDPFTGGRFGNIWGSFEVLKPDGSSYSVGGTSQFSVQPVHRTISTSVQGTFWMNDDFAWMQKGSQSFEIRGYIDGELSINGGVTYPNVTVFFDQMTQSPEICEGSVQGHLMLRDNSGYWFDIFRDDCETCTVIWWQGYKVGNICVWESLDEALNQVRRDAQPWFID